MSPSKKGVADPEWRICMQAAVSDVVRAEKAFDRMRAAGAWRTDDCAFVNVLLDGRDVPAAFSR